MSDLDEQLFSMAIKVAASHMEMAFDKPLEESKVREVEEALRPGSQLRKFAEALRDRMSAEDLSKGPNGREIVRSLVKLKDTTERFLREAKESGLGFNGGSFSAQKYIARHRRFWGLVKSASLEDFSKEAAAPMADLQKFSNDLVDMLEDLEYNFTTGRKELQDLVDESKSGKSLYTTADATSFFNGYNHLFYDYLLEKGGLIPTMGEVSDLTGISGDSETQKAEPAAVKQEQTEEAVAEGEQNQDAPGEASSKITEEAEPVAEEAPAGQEAEQVEKSAPAPDVDTSEMEEVNRILEDLLGEKKHLPKLFNGLEAKISQDPPKLEAAASKASIWATELENDLKSAGLNRDGTFDSSKIQAQRVKKAYQEETLGQASQLTLEKFKEFVDVFSGYAKAYKAAQASDEIDAHGKAWLAGVYKKAVNKTTSNISEFYQELIKGAAPATAPAKADVSAEVGEGSKDPLKAPSLQAKPVSEAAKSKLQGVLKPVGGSVLASVISARINLLQKDMKGVNLKDALTGSPAFEDAMGYAESMVGKLDPKYRTKAEGMDHSVFSEYLNDSEYGWQGIVLDRLDRIAYKLSKNGDVPNKSDFQPEDLAKAIRSVADAEINNDFFSGVAKKMQEEKATQVAEETRVQDDIATTMVASLNKAIQTLVDSQDRHLNFGVERAKSLAEKIAPFSPVFKELLMDRSSLPATLREKYGLIGAEARKAAESMKSLTETVLSGASLTNESVTERLIDTIAKTFESIMTTEGDVSYFKALPGLKLKAIPVRKETEEKDSKASPVEVTKLLINVFRSINEKGTSAAFVKSPDGAALYHLAAQFIGTYRDWHSGFDEKLLGSIGWSQEVADTILPKLTVFVKSVAADKDPSSLLKWLIENGILVDEGSAYKMPVFSALSFDKKVVKSSDADRDSLLSGDAGDLLGGSTAKKTTAPTTDSWGLADASVALNKLGDRSVPAFDKIKEFLPAVVSKLNQPTASDNLKTTLEKITKSLGSAVAIKEGEASTSKADALVGTLQQVYSGKIPLKGFATWMKNNVFELASIPGIFSKEKPVSEKKVSPAKPAAKKDPVQSAIDYATSEGAAPKAKNGPSQLAEVVQDKLSNLDPDGQWATLLESKKELSAPLYVEGLEEPINVPHNKKSVAAGAIIDYANSLGEGDPATPEGLESAVRDAMAGIPVGSAASIVKTASDLLYASEFNIPQSSVSNVLSAFMHTASVAAPTGPYKYNIKLPYDYLKSSMVVFIQCETNAGTPNALRQRLNNKSSVEYPYVAQALRKQLAGALKEHGYVQFDGKQYTSNQYALLNKAFGEANLGSLVKVEDSHTL